MASEPNFITLLESPRWNTGFHLHLLSEADFESKDWTCLWLLKISTFSLNPFHNLRLAKKMNDYKHWYTSLKISNTKLEKDVFTHILFFSSALGFQCYRQEPRASPHHVCRHFPGPCINPKCITLECQEGRSSSGRNHGLSESGSIFIRCIHIWIWDESSSWIQNWYLRYISRYGAGSETKRGTLEYTHQ